MTWVRLGARKGGGSWVPVGTLRTSALLLPSNILAKVSLTFNILLVFSLLHLLILVDIKTKMSVLCEAHLTGAWYSSTQCDLCIPSLPWCIHFVLSWVFHLCEYMSYLFMINIEFIYFFLAVLQRAPSLLFTYHRTLSEPRRSLLISILWRHKSVIMQKGFQGQPKTDQPVALSVRWRFWQIRCVPLYKHALMTSCWLWGPFLEVSKAIISGVEGLWHNICISGSIWSLWSSLLLLSGPCCSLRWTYRLLLIMELWLFFFSIS